MGRKPMFVEAGVPGDLGDACFFVSRTHDRSSRLAKPPYCVGFAAESENLLAHARQKLQKKKVPLIVANIGAATFGEDDNAITLVDAAGEHAWPRAGKLALARRLVAEIAARLAPAR